MWLLNTETLELEHFVDHRDRRLVGRGSAGGSGKPMGYAILSHTWEHDEVTFQDLKSGRGPKKAGYRKIAMTCEQARKDGLSYAWVDTCCINKESSAELSEAINSMWQYYAEAWICYAFFFLTYLEPSVNSREINKTSVRTDPATQSSAYHEWYQILASSWWFTRGWTLQELLAPTSVMFFGQAWNCIGHKAELIDTLSEITGISKLAPWDRDVLPTFAIARKISWAAGCSTTRVEDRAYSLLGILGINMPLLYGEGKHAFTRLQEILAQKSTDQSLLVWQRKDDRNDQSWFSSVFASDQTIF